MSKSSTRTRRQFLQTSLAAGACGLTIPALAGPTGGGEKSARVAIKHGKAPFKVLYNNDTTNILGCSSPYHPKTLPAPKPGCDQRTLPVASSMHLNHPRAGRTPHGW